jgi:hypothetical protein
MSTVRIPTKDNPINKCDIHNCFANPEGRGYAAVPVAVIQRAIGKRVLGLMIQHERLRTVKVGKTECGRLTPDGVEWLKKGILAWMKNHPDKISQVVNPPRETPAPAKAAGRRVLRRAS